MKLYAIDWRLGWGYDWEREERYFETEEIATRYAKFVIGAYFESDEEFDRNVVIRSVTVFKMPYWSSLNPYVATFRDNKLLSLYLGATPRMFENKLIIETNVFGTSIMFWDSGDLKRAKVLAQSMYDGWRFAGGESK